MDYGARIKQRRKQLDISVDELAGRIGKSRATVYRYENGYIEDMPLTVLEPLAKALHTTPAYLMGWTDDPHDWTKIGNDEGIYPPKDYEGSYEDYVKFKVMKEQDDLIDDYYDTYQKAVDYLRELDCSVETIPGSDETLVITPDGEHLKTDTDTLVYNFMIFGKTRPGIKKLTFDARDHLKSPNERAIDTVAAHLAGKDITPKKLKLIEQYIDALFEEDEED